MILDFLRHLSRFFVLLALQVLVFDRIDLSAYTNAFPYVLFIIMLPINLNRFLLLALAFSAGIIVDWFSNTAGMHSTACLIIAFIRPGLLNLIVPRENYDVTIKLSLHGMGFPKFLVYTYVMVLTHHLAMFLIEAFSVLRIDLLLLRVLTCSISTLLLIFLGVFLTSKSTKAEE